MRSFPIIVLFALALATFAACTGEETAEPTATPTEAPAATLSVPLIGLENESLDTMTIPLEDPTVTPSGLKYVDLVIGDGDSPVTGKSVSVHYTGKLLDGTKFDSSHDRGEPIVFPIGTGSVIAGWDEGVASMKVGGKRILEIPADLAYDPGGFGNVIPPNATLIFEVELVAASQ